jgi:NADH:ubiquinone oxidoreductase subunit E
MPALWIAPEKFRWLSDEAIKLVAETLELPFAHVYGVAS